MDDEAVWREDLDRWLEPFLSELIRNALSRFKPDECRNYLAAAGYDADDPA